MYTYLKLQVLKGLGYNLDVFFLVYNKILNTQHNQNKVELRNSTLKKITSWDASYEKF